MDCYQRIKTPQEQKVGRKCETARGTFSKAFRKEKLSSPCFPQVRKCPTQFRNGSLKDVFSVCSKKLLPWLECSTFSAPPAKLLLYVPLRIGNKETSFKNDLLSQKPFLQESNIRNGVGTFLAKNLKKPEVRF